MCQVPNRDTAVLSMNLLSLRLPVVSYLSNLMAIVKPSLPWHSSLVGFLILLKTISFHRVPHTVLLWFSGFSKASFSPPSLWSSWPSLHCSSRHGLRGRFLPSVWIQSPLGQPASISHLITLLNSTSHTRQMHSGAPKNLKHNIKSLFPHITNLFFFSTTVSLC